MMFNKPYWGIIGLLGLIFWIMDFFYLLRSPELFFPLRGKPKSGHKNLLKYVILILGTVSWSLLSIALMKPQKLLGKADDEIEANDIYVVLDVSRSMLAEDFSPNRLEVAKEKITEFMSLNPTDRIGLIIFSERIMTLIPLTRDLTLMEKMVNEIQVGPLGSGTNIGDAVGLAMARLLKTETKRKVIILLTDGVSQVDSITPLQAAQLAKVKKIKIYAIAIGSDENALIPISNFIWGKRYQTIPGGSVDEDTLKGMAEITSGKFFKAKDSNALKNILSEINKLEKVSIKHHGQLIFEQLFFPFLFWGVLSLILAELGRKFLLKEVL